MNSRFIHYFQEIESVKINIQKLINSFTFTRNIQNIAEGSVILRDITFMKCI